MVSVHDYQLVTEAERPALRIENARAELLHHVGLTVFVERHQLVHTEDRQFHRHTHIAARLLGQLGINLVDIIILGDADWRLVITLLTFFIFLDDIQIYPSSQQEIKHRLGRGHLFLIIGSHNVQFCINLSRLVNPPVELNTKK